MKKKEKSGLSQSFVMGIISMVFLVIGYQTALFLHHSAVARIQANRDHPDTVYVYRDIPDDKSYPDMSATAHVERKVSAHSSLVTSVRKKIPLKRIETFRFNPNTASEEDFCRLGFSQKQAASLLNYRKKGGRFHRKTDFAESFVVSDSMYRRLEPYIDIPLVDLNLADSAALDALPGIGGWYASRIVEYRKKLGGFSFKEQLMDIWKFDREKYEMLEDLVTISESGISPYPLWTLPVDSLRLHPYIGDYSAKGIVLYREHNDSSALNAEGLVNAGVISPEYAERFIRCVLAEP